MSKKSTKRYIFSVILFAVFATAGYMMVKWLKSGSEITIPTNLDSIQSPIPDTTDTSRPTIADPIPPKPKPVPPTPDPIPVKKLSKEELTKIINDKDNKNYPRNVKLEYDNLDESKDEQYQASIGNLRTWISSGYCTVTVTDVDYNENGKVTRIKMHINRKE